MCRLTSITPVNAPLTDLVPVLIEDQEGYIWVGVNSGAAVIRFHPTEVDRVAANPAHQPSETLVLLRGARRPSVGVGGRTESVGQLVK